jgi:hypothetical protein
LRERVRALEQVLEPQEAYRLIFVADDADQAVEIARYREENGYRGRVVCMDETDARL